MILEDICDFFVVFDLLNAFVHNDNFGKGYDGCKGVKLPVRKTSRPLVNPRISFFLFNCIYLRAKLAAEM